MSTVATHRFSTKEYHQMADKGVLPPDARVELLDGRIIDTPRISPGHGGATKRLNHYLTQLAKGRWVVSVQSPVYLDESSEPEPDIMWLRPKSDFYSARHPRPRDVLLLIEVADSSLDYDREEKLPAYTRAAISGVWIVNLKDGAIEVHREPEGAAYNSTALLRPGDKARPLAFPDVVLDG